MAKKVRYAVVGLGWIAQDIVLPSFAHAKINSELTAIVSDDPVKLKQIGDHYRVPFRYSYQEYEQCLKSGQIDAVYIALPNSLHYKFVIQTAKAGIHILCEKPMAISEKECMAMTQIAHNHKVKLMIAYRLHFEEGNLKAAKIANSGRLGDIRIFNSTFTMMVKPSNIRMNYQMSRGTLYDTGIYSINAARNVFRDEPTEVIALSSKNNKQAKNVEEMIGAILKFPKERIALLISSFGASSTSMYEVIGTKGTLRVDPAFHHKSEVSHYVKINEKTKKSTFPIRDQFAPELIYFSKCILNNTNPEPSGREGQADVRIIEAIYNSARLGKSIKLNEFQKHARPTIKQTITRKGVPNPRIVHAQAPSQK